MQCAFASTGLLAGARSQVVTNYAVDLCAPACSAESSRRARRQRPAAVAASSFVGESVSRTWVARAAPLVQLPFSVRSKADDTEDDEETEQRNSAKRTAAKEKYSQKLRYSVREAKPEDMKEIKKWVKKERLNPLFLDYKNFFVAISDDTGEFLGCAQVKQLPDVEAEDSNGFVYFEVIKELSSVVVNSAFRGRGVGQALVQRAMEAQARPWKLFLICTRRGMSLYERFGFREHPENKLPIALRAEIALGRTVNGVFGSKGPDGQPIELVGMSIDELKEEEEARKPKGTYVRRKYRSAWR
eukprot:tig00000821_g4519.t1